MFTRTVDSLSRGDEVAVQCMSTTGIRLLEPSFGEKVVVYGRGPPGSFGRRRSDGR